MIRTTTKAIDLVESMPSAPESEALVLGAIVHHPDLLVDALNILSGPDDFYVLANKTVYEAIVALYDQHQQPDLTAIKQRLSDSGTLTDIGGVDYLVGLVEAGFPPSAVQHMNTIRDKARLRYLVDACYTTLQDVSDNPGDAEEVLDRAESRVFDLAHDNVSRDAFLASDEAASLHGRLDRGERPTPGLPTGLVDLDCKCGGLKASEMIVIAGQPSMGKTTLALNIAEYLAVDQKQPVAFVSLETSRQQLVMRMLSSRAGIDSRLIERGQLQDTEWIRFNNAVDDFREGAKLYIVDRRDLTPLQLRAKVRRLVSKAGVKAVFIDYLQLIQSPDRADSREREVAAISRRLKALSGELEIPVIVLSQLNRAVETRENHQPRISDLRESGAIEQDADLVLLLHRPEYYKPDDPTLTGVAKVNIAKNRNGGVGWVELQFNPELTRFRNLEQPTES